MQIRGANKCPCVSFNGSCLGWGFILETEGGTEPKGECVGEGLEKVRGRRAMEGRARKAKSLKKLPVYSHVCRPPHWGHQVSQWLCTTLWALTPRSSDWGLWMARPLRNYLGFQVNALEIIPKAREQQAGSGQQSLLSAFPPQPGPLLACSFLSFSECRWAPSMSGFG